MSRVENPNLEKFIKNFVVNALENYKPIHLENGKLISNSPKDFDIINFINGNLGLMIPHYVVERILALDIGVD